MTEKLGKFDGKDVIRTSISVTNAGDGLSNAMKVEPQLLHLGDKVYVVLECDVANVKFVPLSDDDSLLNRVHTLRAGAATMIDGSIVAAHLEAQAETIRKAKQQAEGYTEGDLVDAAEQAEKDAAAKAEAEAAAQAAGDGTAADDEFRTVGSATPTAPPPPEQDGLEVDADGFAGPPSNVTSIESAGGAKAASANGSTAMAKAVAKKAAAKKAPAKRPAAKKAPAKRSPKS